MQGGYHNRPCKQLRQVTEADASAMRQDSGLMNKISDASQSGMFTS